MPRLRQSQIRSGGPCLPRGRGTEAAKAPIPAATAIHGANHAWVNEGGRRAARRPPAATRPPSTVSTPSHLGGFVPRRRRAIQAARPAAAAMAARSDQRGERLHAPNAPEPSPNRLHGRIVAATASAKETPAIVSRALRGPSGGPASAGGASGPRASARHSLPRTRPRTGTAHDRHSGRPQPSHAATDGLPGCRSQRSLLFAVRSSDGTDEA